jgi:hypothetical protein
VVVDWATGEVVWSIGVGEGLSWVESTLGMIAIICDKTRVRILELGDKVLEETNLQKQRINTRIQELVSNEEKH